MFRTTRFQCLPVTMAVMGMVWSGWASAQSASSTDAGAQRQQIEQGRAVPLPETRAPAVEPRPPEPVSRGLALEVSTFRVEGNTLLGETEVQAALEPWRGRPIGFADLQRATAALAELYRSRGWVVRVFLPPQEIDAGVVTVRVVEASLGDVQTQAAADLKFDAGKARDAVLGRVAPGQPLNTMQVDRALLLLDDLPGLSARGLLQPGARDGQTDVVVVLDDEPVLTGTISGDNHGSKSTEVMRLVLSASLNGLMGRGDQMDASLVQTGGSTYLRAAASLPLGWQGLRAGVSLSGQRYETDLSTQVLEGSSDTAGVEVTYPLIRSQTRNLYATGQAEHKSYLNRSSVGGLLSEYGVRTVSVGLSFNAFDAVGLGGVTSGSLTVTNGSVNLGGSPNQAADAQSTNTQGNFSKVRYGITRQQQLATRWSAVFAVSGQSAGRNMESGERFYLGGANGVRAYPTSEVAGSEGLLSTLELRWRAAPSVTLSGFFDHGRVTVNADNDLISGKADPNTLSLRGAGIGATWTMPSGATLRTTLARRIGSHPSPTPQGTDQDGTLRLNRLWLQVNLPF